MFTYFFGSEAIFVINEYTHGLQYDSCRTEVAVESAWWLSMTWHMFGDKTSGTIMMTQPCI